MEEEKRKRKKETQTMCNSRDCAELYNIYYCIVFKTNNCTWLVGPLETYTQ